MLIPTYFGQASPLWRVQASLQSWSFARLASFDLMFGDLRLVLAALLMRSLVQAADAVVRHVMGRAWRGTRLAESITAAATMVAAAGR